MAVSSLLSSVALHLEAKQSEDSGSQHYEGQSWGLWMDARLREHILKEFNKTDNRLQGLCMYVYGCLCVCVFFVCVTDRKRPVCACDYVQKWNIEIPLLLFKKQTNRILYKTWNSLYFDRDVHFLGEIKGSKIYLHYFLN